MHREKARRQLTREWTGYTVFLETPKEEKKDPFAYLKPKIK